MTAEGWGEATVLGDVLLRSAAARPDHDALVLPDGRWSYGTLAAGAERMARALQALGVSRGDTVGILLPNDAASLSATFGAWLAGATVLPINRRYREHDLRGVLADARPAVVVTSDAADDYVDAHGLLRAAFPDGLPGGARTVLLGDRREAGTLGEADLDALAARTSAAAFHARRAGVRLRDTAVLLFTSGTTARPRGAVLTHEAVARTWTDSGRRLGITGDDRVWNPLPFFHIAGIGANVFTLAAGATVLSDAHFRAPEALRLVRDERATVLFGAVATVTLALQGQPDYDPADLPDVRVLVNTGPEAVMRRMQAALPTAVQTSCLGMTETAGCYAAHDLTDPEDARATTAGRPLPGCEVRIVDSETGQDAPVGEVGELRVRGPGICEGYLDDPERTAAAFDAEGFFRTGDLGRMDADGHVAFAARLKDMIRVGGENMAPAELESVLAELPGVHAVQVVGVADDRLGEVPAAFVEPAAGAELEPEAVVAHCRGRIASFKVPRHVRVVREWPMSATKIQRFRLREQLEAELADQKERGSPSCSPT